MRKLLTHCKWGHPYSGENLFISKNGRRVCRTCRDKRSVEWVTCDPERNRKRQLAWYHALPPKKKKRRAMLGNRRRFGFTPEQYDAKLAAQNNLCGMCGKPFDVEAHDLRPVLDHSHTTGKNRDFVHSNCNVALGMLQDDPAMCRKAEEYLLRHKEITCLTATR
jgi:hypothetical protein